jgi:hypothetical protein
MKLSRMFPVLSILFCLLTAVPAQPRSSSDTPQNLRAAIPAGYQTVRLQPSGAVLSLLGLLECPEIDGAQQVSHGLDSRIMLADGAQLRRFPRYFSFRVTASLRKTIVDPPNSVLNIAQDPAELLLGLKFKLRAYNGLAATEVSPESVSMIGVPADIPYDERVFRISFDVGDRPVTDRFVLEVESSDGEKLGRFAFGLL